MKIKGWKRARLNERERKLLAVVADHIASTWRSPWRVQRTASQLERKGLIQRRDKGWTLTVAGYQQHMLLIVK